MSLAGPLQFSMDSLDGCSAVLNPIFRPDRPQYNCPAPAPPVFPTHPQLAGLRALQTTTSTTAFRMMAVRATVSPTYPKNTLVGMRPGFCLRLPSGARL